MISKTRLSAILKIVISLLLFAYVIFVCNNLASDTWNQQSIGQYFDSSLSISEKEKLGTDNCDCPQISVVTKKGVTEKWQGVLDKLMSPELQGKRALHFLTGSQNPYWHDASSNPFWLNVVVPDLDYQKAKIQHGNGISQKVKIKLCGGLKDHFDTERYSVRIKSDTSVINSINKVNFYNPKVRLGGLGESFAHELLQTSGLMPLRTGYVKLLLNQKEGVYYYQEHPSIDLLVDFNRKPGLIVRLFSQIMPDTDENKLWLWSVYDQKSLPEEFSTTQLEFLENQIIDFNAGLIQPGDLFSIPELGKYGAVIDLVSGYHGAEFRNMYFYLNPNDSLLEPIGREFQVNGYSTLGKSALTTIPRLGKFKQNHILEEDGRVFLHQMRFKEEDLDLFRQHYSQHLLEVSAKEYLDEFFVGFDKELEDRQNCLYLANPEYPTFDKDHFYGNQEMIRDYLEKSGSIN